MAGKYTVKQIENALIKTAGNVSQAARELGADRNTIYNHINASPTLAQVLQNAREELVDIAESALRKEVLDGNITAIIWTLKANPAAKERGWSERHELTGANGGPMKMETWLSELRKAAE